MRNTGLPRDRQPTDQPPRAPTAALARRKNAGTRHHALVEEKNFTGAWQSRAGHLWSRQPETEAAEQESAGEPIWAARVSRKPMNSRRSNAKIWSQLMHKTLYRRDKTTTRTPRRIPREGPPAREQEERKWNKTQTNTAPESKGFGESKTPQPKRLGEHTTSHDEHHGGSKKTTGEGGLPDDQSWGLWFFLSVFFLSALLFWWVFRKMLFKISILFVLLNYFLAFSF